MADFKTNIKNIRIERRLTQKQMSELIGTSLRYYQYYEAGTKKPNIESLKRIANILDVSSDHLIRRDEK